MLKFISQSLCSLLYCMVLGAAAFFSLFFFSPALYASDSVRVATREYLPPYVNASATSGIEIDLVKAIFARTNISIEFVQLPDLRMVQSFAEHTVDGILAQNIETPSMGCATQWYFTHPNVAITLADSALKLTQLKDLKNLALLRFVE